MDNLYQNALKAHYLKPVGLNRSICASHSSEGYNANCGDEICVLMQIDGGAQSIADIAFEADSCAICTASASILCLLCCNANIDTLNDYYQYLKLNLNNPINSKVSEQNKQINHKQLELNELNYLLPVSAHPGRINCALLPWQTAIAALSSPASACACAQSETITHA